MSLLGKLNGADWIKGVFLAVVVAVLTSGLQMLNAGGLSGLDWTALGNVAVTSLVAYIIKALSTDSNGKLFGKIG